MALTDNLVSYWEMEEASGTRVDSHGGNDLTDNNTVTQSTGIISNAAVYTAANSEYLSRADNASLSITGDMSVQWWVYLTDTVATASKAMYLKRTGAGNRGIRLYMFNSGGGDTFKTTLSSNGSAETSKDISLLSNLSTATWYHIVWTYDASAGGCELWVDGTSQGTATLLPTSIYDNTAPVEICYASGPGIKYNGRVDEVGLWSKVLTDDEIGDLYNSGSGLAYPLTVGGGSNANFLMFMQ